MKKTAIIVLLFFWSASLFAHGGDDHAAARKATVTSMRYFSSEAISDKYELLIKYGELARNTPAVLKLFISEAATNRAVDSARLKINIQGLPAFAFNYQQVDTGIYEIRGQFPDNIAYDLQVSVEGPLGPDLVLVPKIGIGQKLVVEEIAVHRHWYDSPLLWGLLGLTVGLALMYLFMKKKVQRTATAILAFVLLIPLSATNPLAAHEGEQHGNANTQGSGLSQAFLVEKETQFLFGILTAPTGTGNFYESTELTGTVTGSPQGLAVIQTPETGKIISLRVTPGQQVSQGQVLAIVEQRVDAGTQIDIIAQRNSLNAEVKAARAQYERLQSIADIAAKKDITEARARYEAAVENLRLFNANVGRQTGSTKMVSLTAPISGVVGTFNYSIGAVVSAGQTLFDITNLDKVYVETQVFESGADRDLSGRFIAFSNQDTATYQLKLVSTAQVVNAENQAQKVVFEIVRPGGKFRIGENVRVLQFGTNRIAGLVIPTAAIMDIDGKPAVFIKDKAEQYSISYIRVGESNALTTAIMKGVEAGEKIVTGNVYQMKMIYLGQ